MSLLRGTAKEALEGFDPKKDNPNNAFDNIPAGEYDAALVKTEHKVFDSGWEAFSIEMEVIGGDFDGRKEFINIGFRGDKIPDFVYNKNIKLVSKLAYVCGVELSDDDWSDEDSLSWAFKQAEGAQFVVEITEAPNKKDPSRPYRNYNFDAYAGDPFANKKTNVEFDENDLPFD